MSKYQSVNPERQSHWYERVNKGDHYISFLCLLGGVALSITGIMGLLKVQWPWQILIQLYLVVGGLLTVFIEIRPYCFQICCNWFNKRLEFWIRCLARMWGRGLFYMFLGSINFAQKDASWFDWIVGIYMLVVGTLCFCLGRAAANKLSNVNTRLGGGSGKNEESIRNAFAQYDTNNNDEISASELSNLFRALGENMSGQEFRAALDYLDTDHSGTISYSEFKQWYETGKPSFV